MSRVAGVLTAVWLCGCSPGYELITDDRQGVWLQGFGFEWVLFNHRMSYLEVTPSGDALGVAVVGGASTTGVSAEVNDGCETDHCKEFPFFDEADVDASWSVVTTDQALGLGSIELLAMREGVSETLRVEAQGNHSFQEPVAVLSGLRIDTDHPYEGTGCYLPKFGWHPRALEVRLSEPRLVQEGRAVDVDVYVRFEAGESLEEDRQCVDEVNEWARVPMGVSVTVLDATDGPWVQEVHQEAAWELGDRVNPDLQEAPESVSLSWESPANVMGWQALQWAFHEEDPESRGAYLRSLRFGISTDGSLAEGSATNRSPATQLSGFSYRFDGTVVAAEVAGEVLRHDVSEIIPVALGEGGEATLVQLTE